MQVVSIKVSDDVKEASQKIFDDIGLSFSAAINIFLKACIKNEGMPFEISSKDKFEKILEERIKESEDPKNLSPSFSSMEEANEWLHS